MKTSNNYSAKDKPDQEEQYKPGQDEERKHPGTGHGHEHDRERDRERKRNWDENTKPKR